MACRRRRKRTWKVGDDLQKPRGASSKRDPSGHKHKSVARWTVADIPEKHRFPIEGASRSSHHPGQMILNRV